MRGVVVLAWAGALAGCTLVSGAADLGVAPAGGRADASANAPDAGAEVRDAASDDGRQPIDREDGGSSDAAVDAPPCTPAVYGPRYPMRAQGTGWGGDLNARGAPDGRSVGSNGSPNPLTLSEYAFVIPSNERIVGIAVTVWRSAEGPVHDVSISLPRGAPKANAGDWPVDYSGMSFPAVTYGGPTDLWGSSWSPSDFSVTFSVSIVAGGVGSGNVDAVGVTVYTCPSP